MKNCTNCKHAEWGRTASGRLHPSGDGRCKYPWKMPPLPASMHWGWQFIRPPRPEGGNISRNKELADHCVYFKRKSGKP